MPLKDERVGGGKTAQLGETGKRTPHSRSKSLHSDPKWPFTALPANRTEPGQLGGMIAERTDAELGKGEIHHLSRKGSITFHRFFFAGLQVSLSKISLTHCSSLPHPRAFN